MKQATKETLIDGMVALVATTIITGITYRVVEYITILLMNGGLN